MKQCLALLIIGAVNSVAAQGFHNGLGFTGATLNVPHSVASGLSYFFGWDLYNTPHSSFSLDAYIKVGTEDKSGLVFPIGLVLLGLDAAAGNAVPLDFSNLKVKFFTQLPLLVHYNWGLGSNYYTERRFGFYFGGGLNFTLTGYTDSGGNQQGANFFGYAADAGVRFKKDIDINISAVVPFKQLIGQITAPVFYGLTLTKLF